MPRYMESFLCVFSLLRYFQWKNRETVPYLLKNNYQVEYYRLFYELDNCKRFSLDYANI